MTDPRITELDRKIKIARNLTVASVSKSLKYIPKSVIKRSFERIKRTLISKLLSEKHDILQAGMTTTKSSRSTSLPRFSFKRWMTPSTIHTVPTTLINKSSKSKSKSKSKK